MPYIDYDANGIITGYYVCQQYEGQLYTDLDCSDTSKLKIVDGIVIDI